MTHANATEPKPQVLVTGANGFIGLWLVPELLNQGYQVIAAMRNPEQRRHKFLQQITPRVTRSDNWQDDIELVAFSLGDTQSHADRLPDAAHSIQVVYHLAAAFAWGLDQHSAHQVNVEGTTSLLSWVAGFQNLQRFIWVGGYRVAQDDNLPEAQLYRKLGAYEASKFIAHRRIIETVERLNIPWTALNPSTVIGDSRSGDTTQSVGVAELVDQLYHGKLKAIPGNRRTFVPLVHVDYLAEFAVAILKRPESAGQQYWLLDSETPPLPDQIRTFAQHMGLQPPARQVPVALLKHLPAMMMPGSKETLSFLAEDRYPTTPAETLANDLSLSRPLQVTNVGQWVDRLVAANFGQAKGQAGSQQPSPEIVGGRFVQGIWEQEITRVSRPGNEQLHNLVLLHGLPLNGDSWNPLLQALPDTVDYRALIPDLPGLGRSGLAPASLRAAGKGFDIHWLADHLDNDKETKLTLVGHSLGAGMALAFALQYPERVRQLILVSPYFLQQSASWLLRQPWSSPLLSRLVPPARLVQGLHPNGEQHPAVASALASLHRPRVRRHLFRYLAMVSGASHRRAMQQMLTEVTVPITLVVGEHDPVVHSLDRPGGSGVSDAGRVAGSHTQSMGPVQVISGAGHNPHLSHPQDVATAIEWRAGQ